MTHHDQKLDLRDQAVVYADETGGPSNKLPKLDPDEQRNGVICSSAGNHAQGVAYAAARLGVVLWTMSRCKLVVEGAAAAPVAALLEGHGRSGTGLEGGLCPEWRKRRSRATTRARAQLIPTSA